MDLADDPEDSRYMKHTPQSENPRRNSLAVVNMFQGVNQKPGADLTSLKAENGESAAYFQTTRKRWSEGRYNNNNNNNFQSFNNSKMDYSWRRNALDRFREDQQQ